MATPTLTIWQGRIEWPVITLCLRFVCWWLSLNKNKKAPGRGLLMGSLSTSTSLAGVRVIQGTGHVGPLLIVICNRMLVLKRLLWFFCHYNRRLCKSAFHRDNVRCRLLDSRFVKCELDGISRSRWSEIIHAGFQTFFSRVEMHRRKFAEVRIRQMDIQTLGLTNICPPGLLTCQW